MLFFVLLSLVSANAAEGPGNTSPSPSAAQTGVSEPIPFFEKNKPSFFLVGKPITKVQISFQVRTLRGIPLYFGYTQLMMWDLFKESSPIRDINFNPEVYYRLELSQEKGSEDRLDLGFFEHESNGKDGLDSRSWNRVFLRYFSHLRADDQRFGWSLKLALPYSMGDDGSRRLPERRGIWELELRVSDLFNRLFEVNEIIFRVYGGGSGRVNPLRGGQELTYREKGSSRAILLPLYIQIFHGYGENLLNADENRWGIRGGFGF